MIGFRTSSERERVSSSRSSQACMSSRSGLLFSWRIARRSSAPRPLMARSISNSASRRLTVSNADRGDRFALHAVSGPLRDIPQFEEAAPGMGEAKGRCDRLFLPLRVEQLLISAEK